MTSALILIDLQNDYFADPELARCRDDLLEHSNELVVRAQATGVPVLEVQTVHARDKSTWALNMREDDQGMALEGTSGVARFRRATRARPRDRQDPRQCLLRHRPGHVACRAQCRPAGAGGSFDRVVDRGHSDRRLRARPARRARRGRHRLDPVAAARQTLECLHQQYRQEVRPAAEISFD